MTGRTNIDRMFRDASAVATLVPASEVFTFLTRSVDLPADWAALVAGEQGGQRVYPSGAVIEKSDADEILFVRTTPVDLTWSEDGVVSKDEYRCRATVTLRVSLIPDRGELVSFRTNVLGSMRGIDAAGLVRYLQPTLQPVLVRLAAEREAAALVDGGDRAAWIEAVREALQPVCFAAGLLPADLIAVRFDSPTLQQVRRVREQAAQRRAEHETQRQLEQAIETAQQDHLDHLGEMLGRLKQYAGDSPDADLPELMRTFSPRERGELYEALFAAESVQPSTRWIVVAAGAALYFFDPQSPAEPLRTFPITGDIGAVRSVQVARLGDGDLRLLVGASHGVYEYDLDGAEPRAVFRADPQAAVRGGVNAAALAGDRVWASHSELGLLCWQRAQPDWAVPVFEDQTRGAHAVRNVQFCNGRIYCSIDDRAVAASADNVSATPERFEGSGSVLTALAIGSGGVYAGNADGQILHWPVERADAPDVLHAGSRRPAESVIELVSGGVGRLFFTDTSLAVSARVLGDTYVCRYEAGGQTLRRVEVAPDLLVATNDTRDRLICWSPSQPGQPAAVVAVSRICRHSVQDVCLVPLT